MSARHYNDCNDGDDGDGGNGEERALVFALSVRCKLGGMMEVEVAELVGGCAGAYKLAHFSHRYTMNTL